MLSRCEAVLLVVGILTAVGCRTKLNGESCLNNPCASGLSCNRVTQLCFVPDGSAIDARPDGDSAGTDAADAKEGGGGDAEAGQASGSVIISSPTVTTHTNKAILIEVSFSTGAAVPPQVELFKNGTALATIVPPAPFNFTWDTTVETEGMYAITARATIGGQAKTSDPVTIIVDRTPPSLLTQIPTPNAVDVDVHAPIQLGFSEPLSPASVTGGAIAISQAGTILTSPAVLGADGRTISTAVVERFTLMLPATLSATIAATITDLAGNAFSPPAGTWSWTAPAWFKAAQVMTGRRPVLRVDQRRRPILAYHVETPIGEVFVQTLQLVAYENGTWATPFGSPTTAPDSARFGYGLALDSAGNPTLVWTEVGSDATYVRVASWTGSSWNTGFPLLDATPGSTSATNPHVRIDKSGRPVVSWIENTGTAGVMDVFVARWTGSTWDHSFGHLGVSDAIVGSGDLVLDAQDSPVVGWSGTSRSGVATWVGGWTLSPALSGSPAPAIALDSAQAPMAAARVPDLRVVHLVGGQWLNQETVVPTSTSIQNPRVALAADGKPVVVWLDTNSPFSIGLAHWTGTMWDLRAGLFNAGAAVDPPSLIPELVVDVDGRFWVAWQESGKINVWKSNY